MLNSTPYLTELRAEASRRADAYYAGLGLLNLNVRIEAKKLNKVSGFNIRRKDYIRRGQYYIDDSFSTDYEYLVKRKAELRVEIHRIKKHLDSDYWHHPEADMELLKRECSMVKSVPMSEISRFDVWRCGRLYGRLSKHIIRLENEINVIDWNISRIINADDVLVDADGISSHIVHDVILSNSTS